MSIVVVTLTAFVAAANISGSGTAKTEKRALTAFTQVQSAGSFQVDVAAGDAPSCEVTADDNVLASVVTEVTKDGVLKVRTKDGDDISTKTPVVVKVTAPSPLQAVARSGSGKTSIVEVKAAPALSLSSSGSGVLSWKGPAERVAVTANGSGAVTLVGKAAKLDASLSGSGKVDAGAFEVQDGVVSTSGSGQASVNAAATLTVNVSGSGKVTYAGAPKLTKKVSGSGSVVGRDAAASATGAATAGADGAPVVEKKEGGW